MELILITGCQLGYRKKINISHLIDLILSIRINSGTIWGKTFKALFVIINHQHDIHDDVNQKIGELKC